MKRFALLLACVTLAAPAAASTPRHPPAVKPQLISHGPRDRKEIALTFDADMTVNMLAELRSGKVKSWYDARITRYLIATHTPATIFLTGLWTRTYPGAVRALARNPLFELENHSWDHAAWTGNCYGLPSIESLRRKLAEVLDTAAEIEQVAGRYPRFFRFPGGCYSQSDVRLVGAVGEKVVGWDDVSGDPFQPHAQPIVDQTLRGAKPGGIVVMHIIGAPNAPATYRVLKVVVPALRKQGYRFVTVEELLGLERRP